MGVGSGLGTKFSSELLVSKEVACSCDLGSASMIGIMEFMISREIIDDLACCCVGRGLSGNFRQKESGWGLLFMLKAFVI